MSIGDCLTHRSEFLEQARDEFGFVTQDLVVSEMLPYMLDSKLIDSEQFEDAFLDIPAPLKLNSYSVSETGERLQLVLVDESKTDERISEADLLVSERANYDNQLNRCFKFLKAAINGTLKNQLQDSHPCMVLVDKLSSASGIEQFDVVEIFLISLTATVSFKGSSPQLKTMHFDDKALTIKASKDGDSIEREILVKLRVIDLNFLSSAINSRGRRESLEVRFRDKYASNIEVIQAAQEKHFESFLCVFDAEILYELYRSHGSRLLEKNVRSFLGMPRKGVNSGIKGTLRNEPEKFIAYNNGVTITAEKSELFHYKKKTYLESLTDMQIVNGGQTTATIYFAKREGIDISRVKVMAKINVAKTGNEKELDDLISSISKYSNSQSRVSPVDLRARSPQLVKLKQLSESVQTPSGSHWFFERAKGEFNTQVRKAGPSGAKIKKLYPSANRFSKEQLAKYFTAWGDQPYLVKKGGEKVFRYFIEEISVESGSSDPTIDRDFYEAVVAKIILFRRLEKIYGSGKNAMGNLRAIVIPYSIAVVYCATDEHPDRGSFDLGAIWKAQDIGDELAELFARLMLLMNDLIKKYSLSDDYGEYSKKPELWSSIKSSPEVHSFENNPQNSAVIKKYTSKKLAN
ncbi:AIPR family protein [Porticoccaceae bacterium]|jgi:hypothetical protein|nr:AIPR family protein [Porticoccaceae bacterium]